MVWLVLGPTRAVLDWPPYVFIGVVLLFWLPLLRSTRFAVMKGERWLVDYPGLLFGLVVEVRYEDLLLAN